MKKMNNFMVVHRDPQVPWETVEENWSKMVDLEPATWLRTYYNVDEKEAVFDFGDFIRCRRNGGKVPLARCQKCGPAKAIKWMVNGIIVLTTRKYAGTFIGILR